jgi:GT2 family glycosyltransferase
MNKEIINSQPLVSVVIVSWNRCEELKFTLQEVKKSTYKNLEIIVVDNASTDGTQEMITKNFPEIKFISLNKNIGIGAYNRGFVESNGEYIVVLDDDSHPALDAIEKMVKKFLKDRSIGGIAFKIISFFTNEDMTKSWKNEVTSFWGCGAGVKKEVLDKVGYYDEDFFLYGNEYDLTIRIWDYGYKFVFDDNIVVYHRISKLCRSSGRLVFYTVRNNIWFYFKYFKIKYLVRTLLIDLFTWFIRASLEGTVIFWMKGFFISLIKINIALRKRKVVKDKVTIFYINNHRNFELPHRKFFRKLKDGSLFKMPKNV